MTEEQLQELEELRAASAPGEWGFNEGLGALMAETGEPWPRFIAGDISAADADYIAALHDALPTLLDAVRRLRDDGVSLARMVERMGVELDDLRAENARLRSAPDPRNAS